MHELIIFQVANAACCMTSMLLAANAVSFLPHRQVYFDETTKIFTDTILSPKASNELRTVDFFMKWTIAVKNFQLIMIIFVMISFVIKANDWLMFSSCSKLMIFDAH
jgi:hypothetical protein